MTIVDNDIVSVSNRNRQLLALKSTEGAEKVDAMAKRLLDINPNLELIKYRTYLKDSVISKVMESPYDYVIDAIDTLSPKLFFIKNSMERKLPLVSSMGAGGRLDPSQIKIADVSKSYGCPFAQVIRKKLHGWEIRSGFKVIFSLSEIESFDTYMSNG